MFVPARCSCLKTPTGRRPLRASSWPNGRTVSCPEWHKGSLTMLSKQRNERITQTGPGTPLGEAFRLYWMPALLSEEIPEPDCPPVRIGLLGEKLVAFRDTNGKVALVAENCPHRGASLFFGRNEEAGIRCVYHGWKFDTQGNCIDMPNEPADSDFKHKVRALAYPTQERGGVLWAYMGPAADIPGLPELEWTRVPASHRYVTKRLQMCSFLQNVEGEVDSSHVSFLHSKGAAPAS